MKNIKHNVKSYILSFVIILCIVFAGCFHAIMNTTKDNLEKYTEVVYDTQLYSQESGQNANTIIHDSDKIIEGKIRKISYLENDGIAWTKLDIIKVKDLLNEKYEQNLSVYVLGGYINTNAYNKYYNVHATGAKVHAIETQLNNCYDVGKQVVAFLVKTDPNSPFERTAYEGLQGNKSIYILDQKGYYTYDENNDKLYLDHDSLPSLHFESR